jgi:hypothetical protein
MAYPAKDHKKWLEQSDFKNIKHSYIQEIDHGVLIAQAE